MFIFTTFLFFVLTPGIVVTIPPKSNKYVVAIVHGVIFALILHCTHTFSLTNTEGTTNTFA